MEMWLWQHNHLQSLTNSSVSCQTGDSRPAQMNNWNKEKVLNVICNRFSLDNLSSTGLLVVITGICYSNPHSGLLHCKCTGFEKCLWWEEELPGSQLISLQWVNADCTVHGASRGESSTDRRDRVPHSTMRRRWAPSFFSAETQLLHCTSGETHSNKSSNK